MKHLFTSFALMATVAISAFAQESDGYRRTWDFTKGWSAETLMKLENDPDHWEVQGTGFQNKVAMTAGTMVVYVNGEPEEVPETSGLEIMNLNSAKHLQVFSTNFGATFPQEQCLWINGKNSNDIVKFKVPAGENVRIGYCTHKNGEARGFTTSVLADENGNKTFKDADATLIHEVVLINNQTEEITEQLKSTSGHHIYYIIIGNGDQEPESDITEINIAYLYDSSYNGAKDADKNPCGYLANGGLEADPIYETLSTYNVTAIDYKGQTLTSAELNDSLLNFDVVVVGEAVSSGNALAKGLVEIVNKVPILNLKSFMYKNGVWGWGAGVNPSPKATALNIPEDYREDPLFADIEISEEGELPLFEIEEGATLNGNLIQAYSATADLIKDNEVLATAGGNLAIHRLGTKNQYLLIPISSDNMDKVHGNVYTLIDNAVKVLSATKSKVLNASAPVISQNAVDQLTTVSITCTTQGSVIYYTTDGTEPTTASAVYTEPFDITTDGVVVKALAAAHGYNLSKVSSAEIIVKSQAAAPAISIEQGEGLATITLLPAEGTIAYFSFNGVAEVASAEVYTEPIIIREPATISAFAASAVTLPSEVVSQEIVVGGIPAVKDTISHFNAGTADWFDAAIIKDADLVDQELPTSNWAAKAAYYWGKSAWAYYTSDIESEEVVKDSLGVAIKSLVNPEQDSIKVTYKADPTAVKYVYSSTDTQWRLRSQGQVLTGECSEGATAIVGNGATGYYAENATDLIGAPTKGKITFGGKTSGDPYTASIESLVKFPAPFDVVTYLTNGGTGEPNLCLQSSVDGETWQTIGQLTNAKTQRYFKKDRFHVDGTDELYLRVAQLSGASKAQLYDIIVISTEGLTGIESIATDAAPAGSRCYDLFGRQLQAPVRGQLFIQGGKKAILR